MKSLQQNLLILVALSLCGLCVYQWHGQTVQRNEIQKLEQTVYDKSAAIQGYTNSISAMDSQIAQMDAQMTQLKAGAKTNAVLIITQRREVNRLQATADGLTNQIAEYKSAVESLQGKLKEAYDGIQKQNAAIKELVTQRDEFVQNLNDSVKERNEIVNKYNELAAQVEKLQPKGARQ
jgi:predicted RNase H-like nuclease (RuvC/YqgF family)